MTNRATLPNRRPHVSFEFDCWGRRFHAGIGHLEHDPSVLEVWINSGKTGTDAETCMRDAAIILSFALQHGASLPAIAKAVTRNPDGGAAGPIGVLIDTMAETGGAV